MPKFTVHSPSGQALAIEAPTQEAALDQVLNTSGPDVSSLGSFGRGAAGMIPLGEQAYAGIAGLAEHKPYLQERQELAKEIEADKEVNPGARLAGQATGVIAPIVATAGLAAPETLLGAAGQGALFGGAYGAGNAIDTLASGGSGAQAAGDVALGAVTGAAGGAAGQAAGNVLGKVSKAILPSADEITAGATAKVFGGNTRDINRLPGKNPVETLNRLRDTALKAEVGGEPLIGITDQMDTRLQKAIDLHNAAGQTIGDAIKGAGVQPLPTQTVLDAVTASAKKFPSPEEAAQFKALPDLLKQYANPEGHLSFDQLHKLKSDLGNDAFSGQGNDVLKNAYHAISDLQEAEMEKAGLANKPAFMKAKEQYSLTSRILPLLKKGVSKDLAGKTSLTVPGAALVTGHPVIAGGALLKPRLEQMANTAIFKGSGALNGIPSTITSHVPSIAGAAAAEKQLPEHNTATDIPLHHAALAPWREVFAKNAASAKDQSEISKAHAVTDFTLSQRDPAYAAAKAKAQADPTQTLEPNKMAEGGTVEPEGMIDGLKKTFGQPVPGFSPTLPGLQNVAEGRSVYPPPEEPLNPVRTAKPLDEFHKPFNTQFEEQIRKYLRKEEDNAH